jgi:hypothetical protein
VWAFNLAPAFPHGALTLCPQLSNSVWAFHSGDKPKSAYRTALVYGIRQINTPSDNLVGRCMLTPVEPHVESAWKLELIACN